MLLICLVVAMMGVNEIVCLFIMNYNYTKLDLFVDFIDSLSQFGNGEERLMLFMLRRFYF